MKIIAHKIANITQAKKALATGADFLEVNVAKRIIFTKFTTQHHGIKGKFGIGQNLSPILSTIPSNKLLLDAKHAAYSLTFTKKLSDLLISYDIKNARICGRNWQTISQVCQKTGCLPFYTIRDTGDIKKIKRLLPKLAQPAGFSIRHDLIDKGFITYCSNAVRTKETSRSRSKNNNRRPGFQIWAWTVNEIKEAKRLQKLGVDGIITDTWSSLKKIFPKVVRLQRE